MRVLRVHHNGGVASQRARDRALQAAGVEVVLAHPLGWPGDDGPSEDVPRHAFAVRRPGDVNRHAYVDQSALASLVEQVRPDLIDIDEEPVSVASRQWLRAAGDRPVVMYSAQNIDKRWPPPFAQYERATLSRVSGFYPCSAQAAAVLRGKGFRGLLHVLPLGVDLDVHHAGAQRLPSDEVVLGLVGRLEPEKGIDDAVRVLASLLAVMPARLLVVGDGSAAAGARRLAAELGVADRCSWLPWCSPAELAGHYRRMHVVLVPSRATTRWVEQFGRVVTEGRANGAVPIAYASGALPEVVDEAGLVVREGDVHGLAAAVVDLALDPARWTSLRQQGVDATHATSWARVAEQQAELYQLALGAVLVAPSRPSSALRRQARGELGAPAATPAGPRPFALPLLRTSGRAPLLLGRAVDRLTGQG